MAAKVRDKELIDALSSLALDGDAPSPTLSLDLATLGLDGCVVDNIGVLPHPVTGEPVRHKIHIAATAASEGATATLSFPVEPVLQRLDELDDARLAAAQAKLEEARRNSGQPLSAGINPFD